jgi:large subunit ribosomal protein L5
MNRLKEKLEKEVKPALMEKFKYKSAMQIPKLEKVVINMGLGEAIANPKALDVAIADLATVTGQRGVITKAKTSVAVFKIRTGMNIGCKVTLRGDKMYVFLDKLFNIVLARIRDFRGISPKSFDGHGNYALGLKEQIIFPEIEYDKVDKIRGMDIIIVTTAKTDEEGAYLLKALGCPFREN